MKILIVLTISALFWSVSSQGKKSTSKATISYNVTVPNSKLFAANNAVSSKEDVEEDFNDQLRAYAGWEHLLSPAPLSIGLLRDLMIMSTQTRDFAIDGQLPRNGEILYVKYPKSFRATLVQIGNEGQRAFMVAHNNMDKIRLLTAGVPGYMREVTEILVTGDEEMVSQYLPAPMLRIREAASASVSLSMAVVWQFDRAINLTSEVLEMCTSEKSIQEANLEKAGREQKRINLTLPLFQQSAEQLNATYSKYAAVIERAEENIKKALEKMPSGWEMIAMDFVQNVGNLFTAAFQTISSIATNYVGNRRNIHLNVDSSTESDDSIEPIDPLAATAARVGIEWDPCIIQHRKHILKMEGLSKHLLESYKKLESIDSVKGLYNPGSDTSKLNAIASEVELCSPVAEIIGQGLEFVSQLALVARRRKPANATEEHFKKDRQFDFDNVLQLFGFEFRSSTMNLKNLVMANQQAVPNITPQLSRAWKQTNSKGLASQKALANCKMKADLAQATLVNTQQAMERTITLIMENNKEVIKLLTEQQNLKLDEIRYSEIIKALTEGLEKLSTLKKHWTNLSIFFNNIANIVQHVVSQKIEDFTKHVQTTSLQLKNIYQKLAIDLLYTKALKATQASSLVNEMAETYVRVSEKYIIPRVSSLSKFIVTDPEKASVERKKLLDQSISDSNAIIEMIVAHKKKIIERIQERKAYIKKEYAFLDQVKQSQIQVLRGKVELEVEKQQRGPRKLSKEEKKKQVQRVLSIRIEKDEFLRENNILDEEEDINPYDF